jgi:hypothetical protein
MKLAIPALLSIMAAAAAGELLRIVDEPTAGMVAPRTYYFSMSTFPSDGLRFGVSAGLLPGFMAGLAYGGYDITGMDDPDWFDELSVRARFRFLDETVDFPALAVGFDNQREPFRAGGHYERLSRGAYLAGSKNFQSPVGDLAFHAGISLSLDDPDHAGCWVGTDVSLPAGFGAALDWDPATNEADSVRFDESGGFVNFEGFWESFGQVRISLQFMDILESGGEPYRALAVDFLGLF